jgi:hypothetical protein
MAQLSAWHVTDHYPDRDTARKFLPVVAGGMVAVVKVAVA